MPHLIVEYSENLFLPQTELLSALHHTLLASGQFDEADIKIRSLPYAVSLNGGSPDNGFIHLTLLLLSGRSDAVKQALGEALCQTAARISTGGKPVQISADTRDMQRDTYAKIIL